MVRWLRWHCPPDTGFEIRTLAVWGRARYLSVTEAPHNTNFHTWMGKKHLCFFQTAETGNRTPDSGVKGSGANHYPRAPALDVRKLSELCPKSLVQSMSKIRVWNQSLKSVSCMLSKSETEVHSLTPKIWSWKSEAESSKFFAIIIIPVWYIVCL